MSTQYLVVGFTQDANQRYATYAQAETPYEAQVRAVTEFRFHDDSDVLSPVAVVDTQGKVVDEETVIGLHYMELADILLNLRIVSDMNKDHLSDASSKVLDFIHDLDLKQLDDGVIFDEEAPWLAARSVAGETVSDGLRRLAEENRELGQAVAIDSAIGYLNAVGERLDRIHWPRKQVA